MIAEFKFAFKVETIVYRGLRTFSNYELKNIWEFRCKQNVFLIYV